MNKHIRHSSVVILDHLMRKMWYQQGKFPLGAALMASAKMKKRPQQLSLLEN